MYIYGEIMSKILGLDLGIASVGYAVVSLDETNFKKGEILQAGVRIFDKAENPQDGASLALPRREARAHRRVLRRKTIRLQQIRALFVKHQILTQSEVESLYKKSCPQVWAIRRNALYELQTPADMCLALLHIAKRRGFRSMRKAAEAKDKQTGELLQGIAQMRNLLAQTHYHTIGELLYNEPTMTPKRNKEGSYSHSVARSMLEEEVTLLLSKQRTFGNTRFSEAFEKEFKEIAFEQRPLRPSVPGKCTFEPAEDRAPKHSYTAEMFAALSKINHIRILRQGKSRPLSDTERKIALDLCLNREKNNFAQLRKLLALSAEESFNISYAAPAKQDKKYDPEKHTPIYTMTGYHTFRRALGDESPLWVENMDNPNDVLDRMASVFSVYKADDQIKHALEKEHISKELIEKVQDISFSGFMNLSLKAMRKLIPFLAEGLTYDEACTRAGYDFLGRGIKTETAKLPPLTQEEQWTITSPVVKRSIAQARKVINALNRLYGPFDAVHIELAREMGRNFKDRREITRKQQERAHERALLKETGIDGIIPRNALELKKLLLWKEQDGRCMYSQTYIKPEEILEEGFCQIDHIIPYSQSFDNSQSNLALCLTKENQDKRNRIPYDYFKSIGRDWDTYAGLVDALPNIPHNKKQKLLRMEYDEKDASEFKERNLNDTKFISSFLRKYLSQNLQLTDKFKEGVFCRNGKLTSDLRMLWGLSKIREEGDKHHALDAIVLACCSNAMMQHISTLYTHKKEDTLKKEKDFFPKPWEGFRTDVENALLDIFVSRPPRKSITGPLHKETFYSAKHLKQGFKTLRTSIQDLTLEKLAKQRELEVKYYGVERNKKLYDLIEQALKKRTDAKEKLSVMLGNTPVHKIKLITEGRGGVPVLEGTAVAENGPMPRVDVFVEGGKYYLVPVYTIHFAQGKLPLLSAPDGKEMDINNFVFSLYKDDFLRIVNKKGEEYEGYFSQYSAQSGQIYLESHDRSAMYQVSGKPACEKKLNKNTFTVLEKYQIDVLGGKHLVKKEKYLTVRRTHNCFGG